MKLAHYSRERVDQIRPTTWLQDAQSMKPNGVWLSDDTDFGWFEWCMGERFGLPNLRYRIIIEIDPDADILHLKTIEDIDAFTQEYSVPPPWPMEHDRLNLGMFINWKGVASQYNGLLITPYQWERRLQMGCSWYYGWDCASACIWDASAFASITIDRNYPTPTQYPDDHD